MSPKASDIGPDGLLVNGKKRRLSVMDPFGGTLGGPLHQYIDLTGVFNANAQMPCEVVLEEMCNVGHWHVIRKLSLGCWDG